MVRNIRGAVAKLPHYILAGLIIIAFVLIWQFVIAEESASDAWVPALHHMPEPTPIPHADSGLLWLVNQENPLPPDFTPQNLVTHHGIRLHPSAHTAYTQMLAAMKVEGGTHGLQLVSAFRPYDYQRNLFNNKVNSLISQGHSAAAAEELASKSLQRPGASEHQTGLALDVTVTGDLTQDFAATKAGQWLAANSHRFGFIIRYPMHKTEITQIIYEPWHLRYVGTPHARIIWENGITLEEYAQFIAGGPYIQWCEHSESRVYFLVTYSEFLLEAPQPGLAAISSTRHGGAGYIMTFSRVVASS